MGRSPAQLAPTESTSIEDVLQSAQNALDFSSPGYAAYTAPVPVRSKL
jgi:hypothetical protein